MVFVTAIIVVVIANGVMDYDVADAKTAPVVKRTVVQQKKKPVVNKPVASKPVVIKKVSSPIYLTASEVKTVVALEIEHFIQQGKLATTTPNTDLLFEKLHTLNRSYRDDVPGFQPYYIPAAALSGVGTFFSATNIGADNLNGNAASLTTLAVSDASTLNNLTVNALASFAGGLSLATPAEGNIIYTDSGAYLSVGGDWTNASSKEYKENFTGLDSDDVLAKISLLPILRWNYKKDASSTTHIGPLAEDFHNTFHVGGSEKNISTIDPAGVALLGIQALNKKIVELEKKLESQNCLSSVRTSVQADTTDSASGTVNQDVSLLLPQTVVSTTTEIVATLLEQSSSTPIVEAIFSEAVITSN